MKEIAMVIKQIRTAYNLTQKQFAKKFFITEKTISNYENGARSPSIDFLQNICDEFGLTLDSITRLSNEDSNPKDLIVSKINDKCAIYDKSKSVYLTPHLYDSIKLSPYNYHIVFNAIKVMDDGVPVPNFTYSAIIDNAGNVTNLNDIVFFPRIPFNRFGVCYAKKAFGLSWQNPESKFYIINNKGQILSNGFRTIMPVLPLFCSNYDLKEEECDYGLYWGIERKPYKFGDDEPILSRKLLYYDGQEINVTFDNIQETKLGCKALEYKDIEIAVAHITKYGPNIITIIPDECFKDGNNYIKIINAVCEYNDNLEEKYQSSDYLKYALKLLKGKVQDILVHIPITEKDIIFPSLSTIKEKYEKKRLLIEIEHFCHYLFEKDSYIITVPKYNKD